MNAMPKDYYQILGVLRTAKPADITAAYHSLARKCHPDAGSSDPESLAMFKLVNEAYEVLSDEHKRRAYDRNRGHYVRIRVSVDSEESISSCTATPDESPSSRAAAVEGRGDIELELPIAPEEARHGGPCDFTLNFASACGQCEGRGRVDGNPCQSCQGQGTTQVKRRLRIVLPRAAQTGMVIRISGHGERFSNLHGDLLVRLRILPCW